MTAEQRIQALEDRVAVLEEALGLTYVAPLEWKLSPMQDRILAMLLKAQAVRRERLSVVLYGLEPNPPISNVIASQISHMRRKLRPRGIEIKSIRGVFGGGYWLDPEVRARLNA